MGHAARIAVMTADDYLAWEAQQAERHEFIDGEIVAMAGAEDRHVTAAGNAFVALRQHLAGTPCRTFMSDMRLQSATTNSYFYPDVLVTCSEADRDRPMAKRDPLLLVEVLSPGTAAYDRGEKFAHYRRLPSLREVAFVDLDSRRVDVYRRGADGLWVLHPFEPGEAVTLASVELTIPAATLFADVDPPAAASGPPAAPATPSAQAGTA